jgi:hypothetical protein
MSSKNQQPKKSPGKGEVVLASVAIAAGAFYFAPLWIKATVVTVLVLIVSVWAVAKAHGMTVGELFTALIGKALVLGFKGLAFSLVEWPLRRGHRLAARFDVRLRAELIAVRTAYHVIDAAALAGTTAWTRAVRLVGRRAGEAAEAVLAVVDEGLERADGARETA